MKQSKAEQRELKLQEERLKLIKELNQIFAEVFDNTIYPTLHKLLLELLKKA